MRVLWEKLSSGCTKSARGAVTRIEGRVSDEVYKEAKQHFTDKELVNLTLAITQINVWNRFNVAFRNVADPTNRMFVN